MKSLDFEYSKHFGEENVIFERKKFIFNPLCLSDEYEIINSLIDEVCAKDERFRPVFVKYKKQQDLLSTNKFDSAFNHQENGDNETKQVFNSNLKSEIIKDEEEDEEEERHKLVYIEADNYEQYNEGEKFNRSSDDEQEGIDYPENRSYSSDDSNDCHDCDDDFY